MSLEINGTGTYHYQGATIEVEYDQDAESPREWDNLGIMHCAHGRYNLGDNNSNELLAEAIRKSSAYRNSWEYVYNFSNHFDLVQMAIKCDMIMLPLYLYDHSGITMNTTGFSCPWDSGQVGYVIVSKERARAEYGTSRVTAKLRAKVERVLRGEVETYDTYLRGEVYGYTAESEEGDFDSCWGYFDLETLEHDVNALF